MAPKLKGHADWLKAIIDDCYHKGKKNKQFFVNNNFEK